MAEPAVIELAMTSQKPPPNGPGAYRPTQRIQPGWQIWDSKAAEWLTVDIAAEFNTGRIRYVCLELEDDGEHVVFDTVKGHKLWCRTTREQAQAARVDWTQTVDGRWITWRDGRTWELVKRHVRFDERVDKSGWYLKHADDRAAVGDYIGTRIGLVKKNAAGRITGAVTSNG